MTFRNMIRQELRTSQVARQNVTRSLEQGSQLHAFGDVGREAHIIIANVEGVAFVHFVP